MMTNDEARRWRDEIYNKILAGRKPEPPKPVLVSEQELGVDALRERHERAQRRLMEAERAEVRQQMAQPLTAEEHNRQTQREAHARACAPPSPYQLRVDKWIEDRQRIAAHERWLRRQLDPVNLGHWSAEGDV